MAMPRKLKLMNVFLNGYSYQGVAKSVTLPKLTRKLENYRGAGMNGSAPIDLGLDDDALSMEWSLGASRIRLSGSFTPQPVWMPYRFVLQALPARRYRRNGTVEVVMRTVRKKSTPARVNRRRHRVENLRGLHLFPADDGR